MAKFQPGQSGNAKGRPTKAEQAMRGMTKNELDTAIRKLRRASGDALGLMIAAMHNPQFTELQRLKYAKDVWDAYVKAISVDNTLKKADNANTPAEEVEDTTPQVVFRIAG